MNPIARYGDVLKTETGNAYHGYHYGGRGIDFDTRMRYVIKEGVKYWEHGVFEFVQCGDRKPDFRRSVERRLNVQFDLHKNTRYTLYTPDGVKLNKNQIQGNPCLLWDKEHDMVINANRSGVKYHCEASPPVSNNSILVTFRDLRKEKELWPEIQKWIDWVKACKSLESERPIYYGYVGDRSLDQWVKNPSEPTGPLYSYMWNSRQEATARIKKEFREQTRIVREFPYLKTKGVAE